LAPGHPGPGTWNPKASLYETSWIPKGTMGFPTERGCKAQGLEGAGAKARSRSQEHESNTKRARPGGRDQEPKSLKPRASISGPPTERGCKAQGLEGARALRLWDFDGSKARCTADHRVIGLPCSVGKGAAQAEIGLLRCAALPGTLGPWPPRSWHLEPEGEPIRDILDPQRDNGFPNGTWLQSAGLRRRRGQGKIGTKAIPRGQGQEVGTKRPRASSQEPRCRDLQMNEAAKRKA
jgi:hypothetical protein